MERKGKKSISAFLLEEMMDVQIHVYFLLVEKQLY